MCPVRCVVTRSLLAWACASIGWGCGTEATGPDACRKIEQARCRKAAACPTFALRGEIGLQECTQFARDHCLHGLAVPDPGPTAVDQCVSAITQATACETISSPETAPACAFLKPTSGADDGGAETSAEAAPDDAGANGESG
jgi:hypothetical protein